jgi:hypothetical protein
LCADADERLKDLTDKTVQAVRPNVDQVAARYASRQLDRTLKKVAHEAKDLATLQASYGAEMAKVDPSAMFATFKSDLEQAIQDRSLAAILRLYDNKGLPALAATVLGLRNAPELIERVERLLGDVEKGRRLREALEKHLPVISVSAGGPSLRNGAAQPSAIEVQETQPRA